MSSILLLSAALFATFGIISPAQAIPLCAPILSIPELDAGTLSVLASCVTGVLVAAQLHYARKGRK